MVELSRRQIQWQIQGTLASASDRRAGVRHDDLRRMGAYADHRADRSVRSFAVRGRCPLDRLARDWLPHRTPASVVASNSGDNWWPVPGYDKVATTLERVFQMYDQPDRFRHLRDLRSHSMTPFIPE